MIGCCAICFSDSIEVRNINLYTVGSEGTWACHTCEMKLVEFTRNLMHEGHMKRRDAMLERRRTQDALDTPSAVSNVVAESNGVPAVRRHAEKVGLK